MGKGRPPLYRFWDAKITVRMTKQQRHKLKLRYSQAKMLDPKLIFNEWALRELRLIPGD